MPAWLENFAMEVMSWAMARPQLRSLPVIRTQRISEALARRLSKYEKVLIHARIMPYCGS